MTTRTDEIAEGIFRISTFEDGMPLNFNQFLIRAEQPLLFHTGHRSMFPDVSAAVAALVPLDRLRWVGFGHVESDECGALNQFLAAAPHAEVTHSVIGCLASLADMADRPPQALGDGDVLDLGGFRVRQIDTPHVPHGWDARLLYEETTGTLFCGDLFTRVGDGDALTTEDIVGPAEDAEDLFGATCLMPSTAPTIRRLADLEPTTLALMHGPSFQGDGAASLRALADGYARRLDAASDAADD